MTQLGVRIRELRGSLSLYEVGKGSGVATADLSRYEQGKYLPSITNLKKLAEYFEVPYEELRFLYYEDFFKDGERKVITQWVFQQNYLEEELNVLKLLGQIPVPQRQAVLKQIMSLLEATEYKT